MTAGEETRLRHYHCSIFYFPNPTTSIISFVSVRILGRWMKVDGELVYSDFLFLRADFFSIEIIILERKGSRIICC